jgi:hypothetical protein
MSLRLTEQRTTDKTTLYHSVGQSYVQAEKQKIEKQKVAKREQRSGERWAANTLLTRIVLSRSIGRRGRAEP